MRNSHISVSFENHILHVNFLNHARVDVIDLVEVYTYASKKAAGHPYCVIFESSGSYEITDEGLYYLSNNPNSINVLGKAYVTNNKGDHLKTKLPLLFDKPELKPPVFNTLTEGKAWLEKILRERA
jgi:hypothetical protein